MSDPVKFCTAWYTLPSSRNVQALSEYSRGLQRLLGERSLSDAATAQLDPSKKKALDAMLAG